MKRIEAVVERQQRVAAESDNDRSSSIESTVDLGSFGPVGRSETEARLFHFATVFWFDPVALGQRPQALLTMLYRSTDRLCRSGAPMKNLTHSASFNSDAKDAHQSLGSNN